MRTCACIDGSPGLAKLSCTPAQHTGMSAEPSLLGGAVMLGGATQGGGGRVQNTQKLVTVIECPVCVLQLTRDNYVCRHWVTGPH